jgi:DNA-binding transcriptional LysR family regulator
MSLDQIRTFVAIAQEGSMRRAAERLHLTQPPLSRQLASLEDELGARLFERVPKGMELAPAGRVFLAHAERILAEVDAARAAVRLPHAAAVGEAPDLERGGSPSGG